MRRFVSCGAVVLWWVLLWYPAFAIWAGCWFGRRVILAGMAQDCQCLVVALLALFMPLAGSAQGAWIQDAWDVWKRAVNGSWKTFAVYAVTALAPVFLAAWWLCVRVGTA